MTAVPRSPTRSLPPVLRRRSAGWLVPALLALAAVGARADDADSGARLDRLLSQARYQEHTEGDAAKALGTYVQLLAEPTLDPEHRGAALLGEARCLVLLSRTDEAVAIWDTIHGDTTLPAEVREEAEKARAASAAAHPSVDQRQLVDAALQRIEEQKREEARGLVEQARRAYDEGRLELARQLCLDAKNLLPENPDADLLLARINKAMPDRGDLLRQLLRFAETKHVQGFRRLRTEVERLAREGIDRYKAEDLSGAADRFQSAIEKIDASEFLPDLREERAYVLVWLRRTIEDGRHRGLDLGHEPPFPDPTTAVAGWRRRFYDLLSEVFTPRPEEEDPLVIYDARPPPVPPDAKEAALVAGAFPEGLSVTRAPGGLVRAWWAERWIRQNVGTGWSESPNPGGPQRILSRFGDALIVQNNRAAHKRVEDLLQGFAPDAPPMAVDIAVLLSTSAGGTRLATRLGLKATPRESGFDLVVSNRLFEECLASVQPLEGVRLLGTTRLTLGGRPSATVEITQRSDENPVFADEPAPSLVLGPDEARYGVWLEVYSEDLPHAPGAPVAALGLSATRRVPLGSVVVPKANAGGDWARLARPMAEQTVEAADVVPHSGTLVLLGLANPFPGSATEFPGLVVLAGARPVRHGTADVPVPDVPLAPQPAPSGPEEREYALGPLATEVVDDLIAASWPQRPMTVPVPLATERRARERYLASELGGAWSGLATDGAESPVTVTGDVARATLLPEQQERLKAAVDRLRAADLTLYDVEVTSAEVTEETLAELLRLGKATTWSNLPGAYLLLDEEAETALDQRMRALSATGGLYALQSRLLARATQKVAASNLHTVRIVEDIRFWRDPGGEMRYTPVNGVAEEGIVVLVRPDLDENGRRLVRVEALAARLKSLERVALPTLGSSAAQVTVPRHYPVQSRTAAPPLGDGQSLLLTLPAPEGTGRVVLVRVGVKRVQ